MSEKEDFDLDSALSSPGGSQSQGNKRSSSVFTYGTPGQHHNSKRKSKQVRKKTKKTEANVVPSSSLVKVKLS